jgi:hypothetical protein
LYNHLWINNKIPDEWKEKIKFPVLKPEKDAKEAENYRPKKHHIMYRVTSCKEASHQ